MRRETVQAYLLLLPAVILLVAFTHWPAIETLDDPLYYLSGPPQMLAGLSAQLAERGVAGDDIRTDAWE